MSHVNPKQVWKLYIALLLESYLEEVYHNLVRQTPERKFMLLTKGASVIIKEKTRELPVYVLQLTASDPGKDQHL